MTASHTGTGRAPGPAMDVAGRHTCLGAGEVLRRCREEGRAALIGYLPVGFPDLATSIRAMFSLSHLPVKPLANSRPGSAR